MARTYGYSERWIKELIKKGNSVVNEFVDFFKLVGLTYINVDGELSEDEKQDYLEYIRMMEEYVDNNLIYM